MSSGGLPPPPRPRGAYSPAVVAAGLVWSAGMTPRVDGALTVTGRLGDGLGVAEGRAAAALAARNALAAVSAAAGGIDRLGPAVSLTVYVACAGDFVELSAVADGASEALAGLLGGRAAARSAVGVQSLPGGAPVEVQLVVSLASPGAG
jgi:enamine deaminase RidA (YjgF/YER057c/UK114 family)